MKRFLFLLLLTACNRSPNDQLVKMHTYDHNGMSETIAAPDRLARYQKIDFTKSQSFAKVNLVYKEGKSKIISYYPSGQINQSLELVDGRPFGNYREWHSNGKPHLFASVLGGNADIDPQSVRGYIFDGLAAVWDEQGNKEAEILYANGFLEGLSRYYHPNGQTSKEVPFLAGKIEGTLIEYDDEGQISSTSNYREGLQEGEARGLGFVEHYKKGLLQSGHYPDSTVVSGEGTRYREIEGGYELAEIHNGLQEGAVLRYEGTSLVQTLHLQNSIKHGEEVTYYPNETPRFSLHWYEGEVDGLMQTYFPSGQIESQREMSHNRREGLSLAWYKDGQLMLSEEYEKNRLIRGKYYPKGTPKAVTEVLQGKGVATLFAPDGRLLRKVHYFDGFPDD